MSVSKDAGLLRDRRTVVVVGLPEKAEGLDIELYFQTTFGHALADDIESVFLRGVGRAHVVFEDVAGECTTVVDR